MGLWQNFYNEPVSRLSLREPVTAVADEKIGEVVLRLREKNLGCAIVIDEQNKPVGILTESMLTKLLDQHGSRVLEQPIASHMAECPWVNLSDPIAYVLEAMQLKNVRFLSVVDEQGCLAGLTGQKGLIEFVADHFPEQVMVQRIGGQPFPSKREGA